MWRESQGAWECLRTSGKSMPLSHVCTSPIPGYLLKDVLTLPPCREGMAACMGNSVRTWRQSYAPSLRQRETQMGVRNHTLMRQRLREAQEEAQENE